MSDEVPAQSIESVIPGLVVERYRVAVEAHVAAGRPGVPSQARMDMARGLLAEFGQDWWRANEGAVHELWEREESMIRATTRVAPAEEAA